MPTTFCTDSITSEYQGSGLHGASEHSLSFRLLRAAFQALESIIGKDHLSTSHVRGHSGDPWKDLVDLLAKKERLKGFYLPRQAVDMRRWRTTLPHLWWILAEDPSLPSFHGAFFDATPPELPPQRPPSSQSGVHQTTRAAMRISFGSCNVTSLYAGEHGCSGKVQLLRDQMREHQLNFLGIQEIRCPATCSLVDNIYRLGTGADGGHWGVELWLNLQQPIGYDGHTPIMISKQDVVFLHQDPRALINEN